MENSKVIIVFGETCGDFGNARWIEYLEICHCSQSTQARVSELKKEYPGFDIEVYEDSPNKIKQV